MSKKGSSLHVGDAWAGVLDVERATGGFGAMRLDGMGARSGVAGGASARLQGAAAAATATARPSMSRRLDGNRIPYAPHVFFLTRRSVPSDSAHRSIQG
ncbi:acyl-CoA dehydrogenase domain protein [Burkholderia pseudomallei MSHR2451]|nr:acyl-CoA dehydrogenase domain protein [Burkholderia pseudomallei MSHR2451]